MAKIAVKDLSFSYEGSYDLIFEHANFQFDTDWKLGFIGRNGRGKTTFLRLLMGQEEYQGEIVTGGVRFDYFPFPVSKMERMTLEVAGEICPELEHWKLQKELSLLEVEEDVLYRPFSSLSNGERTKVLLALLFLRENGFLLIDEPTNHLDMHGREIVSQYLGCKKGFLLVSHDRAFLDGCIDHVLSINRADIQVQRGNFSSWQQNKEYQDRFEQGEHDKISQEVQRLSRAARQGTDWSNKAEKGKYGDSPVDRGYIGHKAAKMMKRAKAVESRRQRALEAKKDLLGNLETTEALKLHPLTHYANTLVRAEELRIFYAGKAATPVLRFCVEQGERVRLSGKNGAGKSSVLKLLAGEALEHSGKLELASNLVISYVPQDVSFLRGDLLEYAREQCISESLFLAILRKLDFSRAQFEKDMESFSAGQKKKVLLARSLCQQAHLYLWDEPLNYIDVLSRMQIEQLILQYAPTMILVEHDRAFGQAVCTRSISITEGEERGV